MKNVLDTMTNKYATLTKSGKKVADYVFANKLETQYLSITLLAEACEVAEATISRFCKTLGYQGYNEFKLALAKDGAAKIGDDDANVYDKILPTDSVGAMSKKLYATDVAAISQTLDLIDESAYTCAAQMLYRAHSVYCLGQGGSGILAKEAWARFLTVAPWFHCIEDSHLQTLAAAMCGADDAILFFSYSGATKDMMDILVPAHEHGAKIILITHFIKSPATAYADVILLCGSREGPLQSGGVAAKMGQLFIIDVLFNEFCRHNPEVIDANREITANAITSKLL